MQKWILIIDTTGLTHYIAIDDISYLTWYQDKAMYELHLKSKTATFFITDDQAEKLTLKLL